MALVKDGRLVVNRKTVISLIVIVLVIIGLTMVAISMTAPKKAEVVVPSGVSGLYGVSGGKVYYRVGRSLIAKPVKGKGLEIITNQLNTAVVSPDNTELFYRTMINYVIDGYKLKLDAQDSTKFAKITDNVWCGLNLYIVSEQGPSSYIVKDTKGTTYFQNVPTSELYCLGDDLAYNASGSLAESEDDGTLTLKYLSKSKGDAVIEIGLQNSPLLQNNKELSYLNSEGSLVLTSGLKDTVLPLRVSNAITTQYSSGEMYIVDSPSTEETGVDLHRVDLLNKNFAKVASYKTTDNIQQNKADIGSNVAFEYENYLYFMVGNSIVRVEL